MVATNIDGKGLQQIYTKSKQLAFQKS